MHNPEREGGTEGGRKREQRETERERKRVGGGRQKLVGHTISLLYISLYEHKLFHVT